MNILQLVLLITWITAGEVSKFSAMTFHLSNERHNDKIFRGSFVTDMRNFPYMVSIEAPQSHVCGGGIFTLKFVITACHCMAELPETDGPAKLKSMSRLSDYSFTAGTKNIAQLEQTSQVRRLKSVHIHPKCQNIRTPIFDQALVMMDRPFEATPYVHPAKMLSWDMTDFQNKIVEMTGQGKEPKCWFAGWGVTRSGDSPHSPSPLLKAIRLKPLNNQECMRRWTAVSKEMFEGFDFWKNGQICALPLPGKLGGVCDGDSGSPFVCDGYLIGTLSIGNCSDGIPSVYPTIGAVLDWVKKNFSAEIKDEDHLPSNTPPPDAFVRVPTQKGGRNLPEVASYQEPLSLNLTIAITILTFLSIKLSIEV